MLRPEPSFVDLEQWVLDFSLVDFVTTPDVDQKSVCMRVLVNVEVSVFLFLAFPNECPKI